MAIVGFTNAFNFIDGIDGLAASVGVLGAGTIAGAALLTGAQIVAPVAIAGASGGFLLRNLPPARVFMGDVGSQYLGFSLAGLALVYDRSAAAPASLVALAFLPIALDTGSTLALRILRGRAWSEAHREHVYQQLVHSGWSHGQTTVLYWLLTAATGAGALLCIGAPASTGWVYWALALPAIAIVLGLQARTSRQIINTEAS